MKHRLWGMIMLLIFDFPLNSQSRIEVGKVYSAKDGVIEVVGKNIARLRKGQKLAIGQPSSGNLLIVTEIYHSKVNCKSLNGRAKIETGLSVYLPEKGTAETELIDSKVPKKDKTTLYE